jgi:hypothetical protein
MRPITAEELLAVWEGGVAFAPHERALAILALASPSGATDELSLLPVSERDARLLRFREQTFGRAIEGLVPCPSCDNTCEVAFRTTDVMPQNAIPDVLTLSADGCEVQFRLPTSANVRAALQNSGDPRGALLQQCIVSSMQNGVAIAAAALPDSVLDAIEEEMERADPASTRIEVTCPFCAHRWLCNLDVGAFLWSEIETWGRNVLAEVHVLATSYGWRETDILGMSAWRRRRYLELIGL